MQLFLPLIIPPIMLLIQNNDMVLNESFFQCINSIISTAPKAIDRYSDIILETINDVLYTQSKNVLELIRLLNENCKDQLITQMYLLLPKVLQLIEVNSKRVPDKEISIKGVQTLNYFHVQVLNDHLYIITPMLLRLCSKSIFPKDL